MIISDYLHYLFSNGIDLKINREGNLQIDLPSLPEKTLEKLQLLKPQLLQRLQQNEYMHNNDWLVHHFGLYYTKRIKAREFFMQRISDDRFLISTYFHYTQPRESEYKEITLDDLKYFGDKIFYTLKYK